MGQSVNSHFDTCYLDQKCIFKLIHDHVFFFFYILPFKKMGWGRYWATHHLRKHDSPSHRGCLLFWSILNKHTIRKMRQLVRDLRAGMKNSSRCIIWAIVQSHYDQFFKKISYHKKLSLLECARKHDGAPLGTNPFLGKSLPHDEVNSLSGPD